MLVWFGGTFSGRLEAPTLYDIQCAYAVWEGQYAYAAWGPSPTIAALAQAGF